MNPYDSWWKALAGIRDCHCQGSQVYVIAPQKHREYWLRESKLIVGTGGKGQGGIAVDVPKIVGEEILHKTLGKGIVEEFVATGNNSSIRIRFSSKTVILQFPYVFSAEIVKLDSDYKQEEIMEYINERKASEEKIIAEERARQEAKRVEKLEEVKVALMKKKKPYISNKPKYGNVAFKLNYCNGGKNKEHFGFCGICSEKLISYNIEKKHHSWCSHPMCPCYQVYIGKKEYRELEKEYDSEDWPCYESIALNKWYVGVGMNGDGTSRRIVGAKEQSLCILTTVMPNEMEIQRLIFGAFLIGRIEEGDENDSGFVYADSEYCLDFTPREARKLLFWDYYINRNHPERKLWGSGLYRFLDDEMSIRILRAMIDCKEGQDGKAQANKIFEQYCRTHPGIHSVLT